jgi:hypothetical protein
LPGAIITKVNTSVEHDGCGGKGFGVFEVDANRLGISGYQQNNSSCTWKNGEQVTNDWLFGNLDRSVVGSIGFGHDHAIAHAGDVPGFDDERVVIDGDEPGFAGVRSNGYTGGFLRPRARFGPTYRDEFSSRGEHVEAAWTVDGNVGYCRADFNTPTWGTESCWIEQGYFAGW